MVERGLRAFGRFGLHTARIVESAVTTRGLSRQFLLHSDRMGRQCFGPVVFSVAPFGMVIAVQGLDVFELFGAQRLLSGLLALVVVRELAPVIAGVLVAAQAGSTMAAELGTMRIQEELDATQVMGVDPVGFHALPRVLALVLITPLLDLLGTLSGLAGGWLVAVGMHGQAHGVFMDELTSMVGPWDLWATVIKSACFGLIVGLIASDQGYHTRGGAEGVGRAVNNTVVLSVIFILMWNYILGAFLYRVA
jgi:phospholipid/cholesterol/gamma-HCH transport system permease protein